MTKSPLVVENFALNTSGALSLAFDGSKRSGCSAEARGPEELAAGAAIVTAAAGLSLPDAAAGGVGSGSGFEQAMSAKEPNNRGRSAFIADAPIHRSRRR